MKKIILFVCSALMLNACVAVQEAKNFTNCKYSLQTIEISDYNVNSLSVDAYIAITNLNRRTAAALKRFEGKFMMNDMPVANISLEDIRIEPGATKTQKLPITVPMKNLNTKLIGLVSMGSVSVDYHITGTAYFDTPLGEVPVPVDMGRRGSNN